MNICNGTYTNGPGKRYAICDRCRRIDYEKNEGDRCAQTLPWPRGRWLGPTAVGIVALVLVASCVS